MFKKITERAGTAAFRAMVAKKDLACPGCGASLADKPSAPDDVVTCASCGTAFTASEWLDAATGSAAADPDTPPHGTRITRATDSAGAVSWSIPASGKSGGLMFFATFWSAITAIVSGGFLMTYLSGKESGGNMPPWLLIPFFGIFWAIGIGMFYAAFRGKYARHRITAGGGVIQLRRELFGRKTDKQLPLADINSISQVEFYQQNYQPVHGVEIRGRSGKLRFGSLLTAAEKSWLVADLRRMIPALAAPPAAAASDVPARQPFFSFVLPPAGVHLLPIGVILTLAGIGGIIVVANMSDTPGTPARGDGDGAWIGRIFDLMSGGFEIVAILTGLLAVAGGIALLVTHLRSRGVETRLEANELEVSIRRYKRGLILSDRSFPRPSVTGISASVSGSANGRPMKRIELIAAGKAIKLISWSDGEKADAFVAEARRALG